MAQADASITDEQTIENTSRSPSGEIQPPPSTMSIAPPSGCCGTNYGRKTIDDATAAGIAMLPQTWIMHHLYLRRHNLFHHTKKQGEWQHKLHLFLEYGTVRHFLEVLLAVDILIVVIVMVLEIQHLSTVVSDYEELYKNLDPQQCLGNNLKTCPSFSGHFGDEHLLDAILGLTYAGIVILVVFLLENVLQFLILGPIKFVTDPLMVLDITVVVISLTFEFLELEELTCEVDEHCAEEHSSQAETAVAMLIVGRCWRFLQFGHGLYMVQESAEKEERLSSHKISGPVEAI